MRFLIAVKGAEIFSFPTKHDRAMFIQDITNGGKTSIEYALSEL